MTLRINFQLDAGNCCFSDAVISDAFQDAVISLVLHRFDSQHRAMRHGDGGISGTRSDDALATLAPIDVRRGIARRFAEEADDTVVDNDLISRRESDLRSI